MISLKLMKIRMTLKVKRLLNKIMRKKFGNRLNNLLKDLIQTIKRIPKHF